MSCERHRLWAILPLTGGDLGPGAASTASFREYEVAERVAYLVLRAHPWSSLEVEGPFGRRAPKHDLRSIGFAEIFADELTARAEYPGAKVLRVVIAEGVRDGD